MEEKGEFRCEQTAHPIKKPNTEGKNIGAEFLIT